MTKLDRIKLALGDNWEDSAEADLLRIAYYLGKTEAAREVCDKRQHKLYI